MAPRRLSLLLCAWVLVGPTLTSSSAQASSTGVFWTTRALLADLFKTSQAVTFEKRREAGAAKDVVVYVGSSGAVVDGYAVVVDEVGQHEPITFGVLTDVAGRVRRIEVMAYREAYGHEVRSQRFLRQYEGRTLQDLDTPRGDVDAISGATVSCNSTRRALKRALQQIELVRSSPPTTTPTTTPTTPTKAP